MALGSLANIQTIATNILNFAQINNSIVKYDKIEKRANVFIIA